MTRHLAVVALLALPAVASAQSTVIPVGPPIISGRVVTGPAIGDAGSALFPVEVAVPPRFSVGGGAMSGYPQVWAPSGSWGGVSYAWPEYPVEIIEPVPVVTRPTRVAVTGTGGTAGTAATSPQVDLSGRAEATLVIQFPAAAELWIGGKKRDGGPSTEWKLTSPELNLGGSYTFDVKARWKAGGKTFEASRSMAVTAGDRKEWVVVSGTEIRE
jgi:uncharacterized protein (TIGR03000 family)